MNAHLPTALAFALSVLPAVAVAQTVETPPAPATDRATLTGYVGGHAHGRAAINQAAGSGNTQANLAAIALAGGGAAVLQLGARQSAAAGDTGRDASAHINGAALHASRGLLSINQAAGAGNAQANLVAIGQGDLATAGLALGQLVTGLDDSALASVAGDAPAADPSSPAPLREAVIAGSALRSSQGIVQVNQTAGAGNRSANAIVLLLPGGTP